MFHIFGPPVVCVTLMGVTDQTFSPRTSTDGSGLPTRPGWRPPTAGAPSTTGQPPEGEQYAEITGSRVFVMLNIFQIQPQPQAPARQQGADPAGRRVRVLYGGAQ